MRRRVQLVILFLALLGAGNIGWSDSFFMTSEEEKREWEEYADFVKMYAIKNGVENEAAGKRPPGGMESWNAHWLSMIKSLAKDPLNQNYIRYLIEHRQKSGLPPLEGYPPEETDVESNKP